MNTVISVGNDGHAMIGNVVQGLIMVGILGWSVFFMLRRIMPKLVANQQRQLANAFNTHGWTKIALWLEPTISTGGGCGSGCNTCGSCALNPNKESPNESVVKDVMQQPVQWKSPTSSKSSGCH